MLVLKKVVIYVIREETRGNNAPIITFMFPCWESRFKGSEECYQDVDKVGNYVLTHQ